MKRARLLIYDGDEDWIYTTKRREFIQNGCSYSCAGGTVRSVELLPEEIELFDCKPEVKA